MRDVHKPQENFFKGFEKRTVLSQLLARSLQICASPLGVRNNQPTSSTRDVSGRGGKKWVKMPLRTCVS